MNKRGIFSFLMVIMMLCAALTGCAKPADTAAAAETAGTAEKMEQTEAQEPYKFALFCPITGNNAMYGQTYVAACSILVDSVNAAGGVNGHPVQLDIYDDKADSKEAVNIATRLISDDKLLGVVGSQTSSCSLAAGPIYQEAGIPMISPQAAHVDFSKLGDYCFRLQQSIAAENLQCAQYIKEVLGITRAAIIYANDDGGVSTMQTLVDAFDAYGIETVAKETYVPNSTSDFTTNISKIKEANPELLYITGNYTDDANVVKQGRELELDCIYFGINMFYTSAMIELCGNAAEGCLVENTLNQFNDDPEYLAFAKQYQEKTGHEVDTFTTQPYDSLNLLINAAKEAGPDRVAMKDWLSKVTDWPGMSGTFSFDENGDPHKKVYIYEIKDGKFVQISDCEGNKF